MTDNTILKKLCTGDQVVWNDFIKEHKGYLMKIIHKEGWFLNDADKDDIFQLTCMTIMKVIHRYDPKTSDIKSFLYGICYNTCRNVRRKKGKESEKFIEEGEEHIITKAHQTNEFSNPFGKQEFWTEYNKCLGRVSLHLRRPFLMKEDGNNYNVISTSLNITSAAVGSRIFKAREQLRECFKKYLIDD